MRRILSVTPYGIKITYKVGTEIVWAEYVSLIVPGQVYRTTSAMGNWIAFALLVLVGDLVIRTVQNVL